MGRRILRFMLSGIVNRLAEEAQSASEEELLRRARELNPQALGELYRRHVGAIYRYLHLRVGRRETAEDLASEVFLKALESIGSYQYRGVPFEAWLFRIAHDRLVDYFRRQGREAVSLPESLANVADNPGSKAEEVWMQERVRWALGKLTEEQQMVISLKFGEGFTNAQVGHIMKKNEGAIKALQHRALTNLKKILAEYEED